MNEDNKSTLTREDEELLMGLAADDVQDGDSDEAKAVADETPEVSETEGEIEKYRNLIGELEAKLHKAEEERAAKEKELRCISLLGDAGLPTELSEAVLVSDDMEKTVGLIAGAVKALVEEEVSKRCRTAAPQSGTGAPMTREELAKLPVAELQRLRDSGLAKLG